MKKQGELQLLFQSIWFRCRCLDPLTPALAQVSGEGDFQQDTFVLCSDWYQSKD